MIRKLLKAVAPKPSGSTGVETPTFNSENRRQTLAKVKAAGAVGLIAGNGPFPFHFIEGARENGCLVHTVAYIDEASKDIEKPSASTEWIRLGQLGKLIHSFKESNVKFVAMAGGINRVQHFGDVKLDTRGAAMIFRLRSTKDDVVMRGIAEELLKDGIEIIDCTLFLEDCLAPLGLLAGKKLSEQEHTDVKTGTDAIRAMSSQDIGQVVVVREGVVVAVEAVEGTDATLLRGGKLGGKGSVAVKFAKTTQDMRFDVPTIGLKTVETMKQAGIRVLALESGRSLIVDKEKVFKAAKQAGISIIGCNPLITDELHQTRGV